MILLRVWICIESESKSGEITNAISAQRHKDKNEIKYTACQIKFKLNCPEVLRKCLALIHYTKYKNTVVSTWI